MPAQASWRKLLVRIHRNEEGAVSLETVLVIGAIALPVLIFLIKIGWPKIKGYFTNGLQQLEEGSQSG